MVGWLNTALGIAVIAMAASRSHSGSRAAEDRETVPWRVHYVIASYQGDVDVWASPDADREHVIALARKQLARKSGAPLPFGAESYQVERLDD